MGNHSDIIIIGNNCHIRTKNVENADGWFPTLISWFAGNNFNRFIIYTIISNLTPIGTLGEKEGLTLIITTNDALSNGIRFDTVYKLISLTVHSSLNAVGLTVAIATKLASKNISANVVAAYYRDHIFVQKEKAGQAMEAIKELQAESLVNA